MKESRYDRDRTEMVVGLICLNEIRKLNWYLAYGRLSLHEIQIINREKMRLVNFGLGSPDEVPTIFRLMTQSIPITYGS